MTTPLAWKNLKHNWVRTSVGMAGVGFAAMLIFMQMGFKGAIERTATQIYDALEFDLMLRSPAYLHLTEARSFPEQRLLQALALPEVERARPLHISLSEWQTPARIDGHPPNEQAEPGMGRGIIVLGVDPTDPPFAADRPALNDAAHGLTSSRFVLVDSKSKPEYGPQRGDRFSEHDIGVQTALGPNRVQVVGLFELGSGMVCNGASMANRVGFFDACPIETRGEVNLGLIKLADNRGDDPAAVAAAAAAIRQALGTNGPDANVHVLTRAEVNAQEERRWMEETPFGAIFTLGVLVSVFVGVAIVYQVLSNDIANLMGEYATLKAIGYSNDYLSAVVMKQSVLLALVSFVPSLGIAWLLYQLVAASAGIPMVLTPTIIGWVLLLTVAMCLVSGIAALRRLFTADPASLF